MNYVSVFKKEFALLPAIYKSSSCSPSLYTLAIVSHSGGIFVYTVESHCDFNFTSLVANETKHISCLLAIWLSSFVMYLFETLKTFLFSPSQKNREIFDFFLTHSSHIQNASLCQICIANIFSHSVVWPFHFFFFFLGTCSEDVFACPQGLL